jgi:hypothetical protein
MSAERRTSFHRGVSGAHQTKLSVPTDAEINFLWSFIQGSIMVPETWNALLRSYGFCERHAWIHIGVEMSFRDDYLLGPTILYGELVDKALHAIDALRFVGLHTLEYKPLAGGPCFLCAMNIQNASAGVCPPTRLDRGRDNGKLRDFAARLEGAWRSFVCPECARQERAGTAPTCCRRHLLAAMKTRMPVDISTQREQLHRLSDHIARYQKSFLAGGPEASDQDRAALIVAVGWCSGWRPLLSQLSSGAAEKRSPDSL